MDKIEFEKKILDILIEADYLKKGQLTKSVNIRLDIGDLPEVDINFVVASI